MSLLLCLKKEKIGATDVIEILKKIEKFIFIVFSISRNRSRVYDSKFYGLAKDLNDSTDKWKIVSIIKDINDLLDFKDKDKKSIVDKFQNYMKDKNYNFYTWDGIRYFLYEYEDKLRKQNLDNEIKIKWEDTKGREKDSKAIEHIYPQKPDPNSEYWKEKFKDYNILVTDNDVIKKQKTDNKNNLTHSLGNLVLIGGAKNSSVSNNGFDEKRFAYQTGSYSQIEVAKSSDWTPKTILKRGIELLEFLEERGGIEITDKKKLLGLSNNESK